MIRDGWRVGRNPPSVGCSICLIGEPAPPTDDHWRLFPLSQRSRDPFHPCAGPPSDKSPGRSPAIIVTWYRPGIVSAPPHKLSPATLRGTRPPCGWSFLEIFRSRNCTPTRQPKNSRDNPTIRLFRKRLGFRFGFFLGTFEEHPSNEQET